MSGDITAVRKLSATESDRIRSDLLESEQQFSDTWSSVPGRFVVPAEEVSDLITDPSGARILSAFAAHGYPEVYCSTTSDLGSAHSDQAVLTPLADVNDWRWDHAPLDVVVASPDLAVAVLFSVDEFILIGGNRGFVESALGRSIADGCAEFKAYAEDMATASRHLPELARRFCE
ncbi:hypothetical protein [Nocardia sp. NPDC005366]|uniref:hypothetical protein n=1 Tax=Nocardia sp. NPDC005366 TaxID=3156878 RepID=UPI0033ADC2F7